MSQETSRLVHFCYGGTSGSTEVAMGIARASARPDRHSYVFYGVHGLRQDYIEQLKALGCQWCYVLKNRGVDLRCCKQASRTVASSPADVAVFHGWQSLPILLGLRLRRPEMPVIAVQHGSPQALQSPVKGPLCAAYSSLAARTVAISPAIAAIIRQKSLLRVACRNMRTIVNGVDEVFWKADPPDASQGAMLLGMAGMLAPTKDHATIIRAVADLKHTEVGPRAGPRVTLELAGSGSEEMNLRLLARQLGVQDRVRFLGVLHREQMRDAMHRWQVLIHSTHGEGLPMAIIQGMLARRPIIASDSPGVQGLIAHGRTGLLFPPGDHWSLSAAITQLFFEPERARTMALAAGEEAQAKYTAARMAREYEELADELAQASARGRGR